MGALCTAHTLCTALDPDRLPLSRHGPTPRPGSMPARLRSRPACRRPRRGRRDRLHALAIDRAKSNDPLLTSFPKSPVTPPGGDETLGPARPQCGGGTAGQASVGAQIPTGRKLSAAVAGKEEARCGCGRVGGRDRERDRECERGEGDRIK